VAGYVAIHGFHRVDRRSVRESTTAVSARLRRRHHASAAVLVSAKVWTFLGLALAQGMPLSATKNPADGRLAVRVLYTAPSGCPDTAEFEAELHKRTGKARPAADSEVAHVFRVQIRALPNGAMVGRIATEWNGQRSGVRELRDKSCSEVASALALTAALTIDPEARLDLEPDATKIAPAAAAQPPQPPPLPASETTDDRATSEPSPASTKLETHLGIEAGATRIITPGVMPALGACGELAWVGSGLVSPSIRLSLNSASNTLDANRVANFTWLAGELELCPIALRLGAGTDLSPCAAGAGGAILAKGRTVPEQYGQTRAWWGAGLSAHLSQRLSARFGVELFAALLAPLRARSFVFANPSQEIARTPAASGELGLGAFAYLP
jgi:hypothetical protein